MAHQQQWGVLTPHYKTGYFLGTSTTLYSATLFAIAGVFWFDEANPWFRFTLFGWALLVLFFLSAGLARHSLQILSWAFTLACTFFLSISIYLLSYVIYQDAVRFGLSQQDVHVVNRLLTFLGLWSICFSLLGFYAWSRIQHPEYTGESPDYVLD